MDSAKATIRLTYNTKQGGQLTLTSDKSAKPAFNVLAYFNPGVKDFPDLDVQIAPAADSDLFFPDRKIPKGITGFQIEVKKDSKATQLGLYFFSGQKNLEGTAAFMTTSRSKPEGPLEKAPVIDVMGYAIWF